MRIVTSFSFSLRPSKEGHFFICEICIFISCFLRRGFVVSALFYCDDLGREVKNMWIEYNPNPCQRRVGDCAVRAISKALDMSWESAFITLALNALQMCDMPSSDSVIGATLRQHGFVRKQIPSSCPDCYTVEEFCREYPTGTYVLFFGGHVCCIQDGNDYDAWDSSQEIPQYFWTNERSN